MEGKVGASGEAEWDLSGWNGVVKMKIGGDGRGVTRIKNK